LIYAPEGDLLTPRSSIKKETQEEYAKWLSSVFGRTTRVGLGTYTFRTPSGSSKRWTEPGRQYVSRAALQLAGLLVANGSTFFVTLEEGSDTRRLHLHSLETNELRTRALIHKWWAKKYGFESHRLVSSLAGVSMYVTKYVTKSDLPFWAGGPLFRELQGEGAPGVDKGVKVADGESAHVARASG